MTAFCISAQILIRVAQRIKEWGENLEQVRIVGSEHATPTEAARVVEKRANDFLANELPKFGEVIDIKFSAAGTEHMYFVTALIRYKTK